MYENDLRWQRLYENDQVVIKRAGMTNTLWEMTRTVWKSPGLFKITQNKWDSMKRTRTVWNDQKWMRPYENVQYPVKWPWMSETLCKWSGPYEMAQRDDDRMEMNRTERPLSYKHDQNRMWWQGSTKTAWQWPGPYETAARNKTASKLQEPYEKTGNAGHCMKRTKTVWNDQE